MRALVLAVLCVSSVANARPKVAIAAFAGDTKDHARHAVETVIDHDVKIVGADETKKSLSERELKRLSSELDVDAVVHAKLTGGDNKVMRFSLFVHGKKSGQFRVQYKSLKSEKFKRAVREQLLASLEPNEPEADKDNDDAPVGVTAKSSLLEHHGRGIERAAVRVDAGPSASSRVLTFSSRGYPQAPPGYRNAAAGGVRVDGELYPLAFIAPSSPVAGIGVAGSYDKTLGLEVAQPDAGMPRVPVDAHVWSVGARFRLGLGQEHGPTMTFAADYGHRRFALDRTKGSIDMPDVDYAGFEPGLDVRVPLGGTFALLAGGRATLLRAAGGIQNADSYGRAHITGGRAMVGLDVLLGTHVAMRLAGEAAMLKMTFYGTGVMTTSRDNDPMTLDVGGATDRYYGGSATVAVFY